MNTPTILLFILICPVLSYFQQKHFIHFGSNQPHTTKFCGFNSLPFLSFGNGSFFHWNQELFRFDHHTVIDFSCYKSNEQADEKNRILALFRSGFASSSIDPFLYNIQKEGIVAVDWNPLGDDDIIIDVIVSATLIGFEIMRKGTYLFEMYKINDRKMVLSKALNLDSKPIINIDRFESLFIIQKDSILSIYYGQQYKHQLDLQVSSPSLDIFHVKDLGWYSPNGISKFIVSYWKQTDLNFGLFFDRVIQTKYISQSQISASISDLNLSDSYQVRLHCDQRTFLFNNSSDCLVDDDKICIVMKPQSFHLECSQQHQSKLGKVKIVSMTSAVDGNGNTLRLYEQENDQNGDEYWKIFEVGFVIVGMLITLMIVIIIKSKRNRLSFADVLRCKCLRKPNKQTNDENDDNYSQLSD